MGRIQKATRKKLKLRMMIAAPPKAGKSTTASRIAIGLAMHEAAKRGKPGEIRIGAIDTEHEALSKILGHTYDGTPFEFDTINLESFAPTEYTSAIEEHCRAGCDVLIVDSLSHAWEGADGALEIKDRVAKASGNSYTAWKDVTPMHRRMVEAILHAPCHVIVTMRSKVEYVLETNDKGKQEPRKVGMAPIQRAGMEYEFDICAEIDWSHLMTVSGSRCPSVDNTTTFKPGASWVVPVIEWLETGVSTAAPQLVRVMVTDDQVARIVGKLSAAGKRDLEKEKKELFRRYTVEQFTQLTEEQANDYEKRLDQAIQQAAKKQPAATPAPAATPTAEPSPSAATNGTGAAPPAASVGPVVTAQGANERRVVENIVGVPVDATATLDDPRHGTSTLPALRTAPRTVSIQQINKLLELRGLYFHLKGVHTPEAVAERWAVVLADPKRAVKSDADLSEAQAGDLILSLTVNVDKMEKAAQEVANDTAGKRF